MKTMIIPNTDHLATVDKKIMKSMQNHNYDRVESEQLFHDFFVFLRINNITRKTLMSDPLTLDTLTQVCFIFVDKVGLSSRRNVAIINMCASFFDRDIFLDDCVIHLLKYLDSLIASVDSNRVLSYAIRTINSTVSAFAHEYQKKYMPKIKLKIEDFEIEDSNHNNYASTSLFVHLSEETWNTLFESNTNIENDYINEHCISETREEAIRLLTYCKAFGRFEVLCFLATCKLIDDPRIWSFSTPSKLANILTKYDLKTVSDSCFHTIAKIFNISFEDYFGSFSDNYMPSFTE